MEKIGSNGKGNKRNLKKPMKKDTIFKITLYITFLVAGIFLLKNIIVGSIAGIVIIGICLGVFALGLAVMKALKVSTDILYPAVSLALVCVISIISINSGESYSDDFALLLGSDSADGVVFETSVSENADSARGYSACDSVSVRAGESGRIVAVYSLYGDL